MLWADACFTNGDRDMTTIQSLRQMTIRRLGMRPPVAPRLCAATSRSRRDSKSGSWRYIAYLRPGLLRSRRWRLQLVSVDCEVLFPECAVSSPELQLSVAYGCSTS